MAKLSNKYYFSGGVCKSEKRLDGKVIIITGSNTGIGFEAALDLAKRGISNVRLVWTERDFNSNYKQRCKSDSSLSRFEKSPTSMR